MSFGVVMMFLAARPVLEVGDVIARHHALDGRVVKVQGWLDGCAGLSCGLCSEKQDPERSNWEGQCVSIGTHSSFDRNVVPARWHKVVLKARVSAVCFGDPQPNGDLIVCTDRADQLRPINIVRILPAQAAEDIAK